MKDFEDPYNMDQTAPDAYATNYGVEVEENKHDPQYGQIMVKFRHNASQSTKLLMGLEQAKELQEKLAEVVLSAEYDMDAMWRFVSESYGDYSISRSDWTSKGIYSFVAEFHVVGTDAFRKGADKEQQ